MTAPSPVTGYQNAARIAGDVQAHGTTLTEAAPRSGKNSAAECDRVIVPASTIGRGLEGA